MKTHCSMQQQQQQQQSGVEAQAGEQRPVNRPTICFLIIEYANTLCKQPSRKHWNEPLQYSLTRKASITLICCCGCWRRSRLEKGLNVCANYSVDRVGCNSPSHCPTLTRLTNRSAAFASYQQTKCYLFLQFHTTDLNRSLDIGLILTAIV